MTKERNRAKFETLALHVGQEEADPSTGAVLFLYIRRPHMYLKTLTKLKDALPLAMREIYMVG